MTSSRDEPAALGEEDRRTLLQLARHELEVRLAAAARRNIPCGPALDRPGGLFVTLRKEAQLRGCIGWVISEEPLRRGILRCALAAATDDPRFPPVEARELPDLRIEVSVLSPLVRVRRPQEIEVGRHGVRIEQGERRGLLLPQVAEEAGWDREALLEGVCQKAGLPRGSWKNADLQRFTAEVFGEPGELPPPVTDGACPRSGSPRRT